MSTLESFRDDLIRDIDETLNLIRTVNAIMSQTGLSINLSVSQRDTIVEWAFVSVLAAWENFLENCFLTYMLGDQTASGYRPVRYVFPSDRRHALGIILAGREFFQWTDPKRVKKQADLCFENGEPFRAVLDSATTDLVEMNTVRNAIVDRSMVALENFKSLVRDKLKTAPLGIRPGIFLATIKPMTLQTAFLSGYCNKLRVIAKKIVPQ
jgi:hypothetical protein